MVRKQGDPRLAVGRENLIFPKARSVDTPGELSRPGVARMLWNESLSCTGKRRFSLCMRFEEGFWGFFFGVPVFRFSVSKSSWPEDSIISNPMTLSLSGQAVALHIMPKLQA